MRPPAVELPLPGLERDQPSHGDQFLPRLLDPPQADAERLGDPRRLDPPPRPASAVLQVQAADQVAEDGGDQGGPGAAGQQPQDAARHRHPPPMVGEATKEPLEGGPVGQGHGINGCRKPDG